MNLFLVFLLLLHLALPAFAFQLTAVFIAVPKGTPGKFNLNCENFYNINRDGITDKYLHETIKTFGENVQLAADVVSLVESSDVITMILVNSAYEGLKIKYEPVDGTEALYIGDLENKAGVRFVLARCGTTKCDVVSVPTAAFENCLSPRSFADTPANALRRWIKFGA
eukprot:GHVS01088685.1.p1 GENE.GHVS01088685.1~~GHVS01088685.1.p1  ORF type:complete len:168 (+),score=9.85 GHVS01088685.1:85-588(+)